MLLCFNIFIVIFLFMYNCEIIYLCLMCFCFLMIRYKM